jgi:hypothetical protein
MSPASPGDLLARQHLEVRLGHGLLPLGQLGLADGAVALAEHGVDLTGLAAERFGGGQVEQGVGGAAGRVGVAEADVPDDRELLAAALADDGDGIADGEVAVVEAAEVEDDLVGAVRRPAVVDRPR